MRVSDVHVNVGGPEGDSFWLIPMFVCTYSFVRRPDGGLVASPVREDAGVHTGYLLSRKDTNPICSGSITYSLRVVEASCIPCS